jgi:hypothetical protein
VGRRCLRTYDLSEEEKQVLERNNERLRELCGRLVEEGIADLAPARLSWALGMVSHMVNRRQFKLEGIRIGVNPRGYVDRGVPVLRVETPEGSLRAVAFGCSCHNTTLTGGNLLITADYAGYAQRRIERDRPGVRALFVEGCGADANPYPRREYKYAESHGEGLGAEVGRVLDEEEFEPVAGPLHVAFERVDLPLEGPPSTEALARMRRGEAYEGRLADRLEGILKSGKPWPTGFPAPVAVWRFEEGLNFVALPGEVVSDYVTLMERTLGPRKLWVAGYCNAYFGYLPSARVHAEGGYEGHDYISDWGFLDGSVEDVILETVRRLARQARPVGAGE